MPMKIVAMLRRHAARHHHQQPHQIPQDFDTPEQKIPATASPGVTGKPA